MYHNLIVSSNVLQLKTLLLFQVNFWVREGIVIHSWICHCLIFTSTSYSNIIYCTDLNIIYIDRFMVLDIVPASGLAVMRTGGLEPALVLGLLVAQLDRLELLLLFAFSPMIGRVRNRGL